MKDEDIIQILTKKYSSAGAYFLLYKVITANSENNVCELSQEELGQKINKTRQFVSEALRELKKTGLIDFKYKKIIIFEKQRLTKEFKNNKIGE